MSIVVAGGVVQRPRGTRAVFTGPHTQRTHIQPRSAATGERRQAPAQRASSSSLWECASASPSDSRTRIWCFYVNLESFHERAECPKRVTQATTPQREKKVRRRLLRIGTVATAPSSPAKARDGRDGQGEGERVATQQLRVYTHARQLCAVWQQLLRVDPELVDLQRKATGGAVRRRERVWRSGWEEAVREEAVTEASRGGTPAGGEAGRGAAPAAAG